MEFYDEIVDVKENGFSGNIIKPFSQLKNYDFRKNL